MNQQINNYNSDSINNFKILALILVVFIFGILTGIGILQFTTDFDDNINQKEEIKIANASI
ncbi:hypothetical protein MUO66_10165, partial [Candidatus Bathyarchaeota archaeon]|nr:hypothetical protein [Candidatus Bathyarchaeota archaeon]